MRYLTKSRFRLGIDCPSKLYYTKKENLYANTKDLDTFMQALASGGFQVEELAQKYSQTIGQLGISSKNFPDNHIWIKEKDVSPYDTLPAVDLSVIKDSVSGINRISDGGTALSAYT